MKSKDNEKRRNEGIKEAFESVCEEYLIVFCYMYDLGYEKDAWVAGEPGTVANIGDYFVNFDDIRYCVDNCLGWDDFIGNYDYNLEASYLGLPYINLPSWVKGCQRPTKEEIQKLRAMKDDFLKQAEEYSEKYLGTPAKGGFTL